MAAAPGEVAERVTAFGQRAPVQPVHAAAGEVQRGADADQRAQLAAEAQLGVAVMDVPVLAGVVGQPRVGRRLGEQVVEQARPLPRFGGVDDREPPVKEVVDLGEVGVAWRLLNGQPIAIRRLCAEDAGQQGSP